jgi:predicted DNA-binding ribbon-helix-helix protein
MNYDGPWISKIYIYFDDSDGPCIAETSILMPKFSISMVGFQTSISMNLQFWYRISKLRYKRHTIMLQWCLKSLENQQPRNNYGTKYAECAQHYILAQNRQHMLEKMTQNIKNIYNSEYVLYVQNIPVNMLGPARYSMQYAECAE